MQNFNRLRIALSWVARGLFVLYVMETFRGEYTICQEIHHIGVLDTRPKRYSPWNAECIFANFSLPELA